MRGHLGGWEGVIIELCGGLDWLDLLAVGHYSFRSFAANGWNFVQKSTKFFGCETPEQEVMADTGGGPDTGGPGLTQGLEIAVGVGLGVVIGMWWDRHHGSAPWGLLIGLLLGCAAGMYLVIKEAIRSNKD